MADEGKEIQKAQKDVQFAWQGKQEKLQDDFDEQSRGGVTVDGAVSRALKLQDRRRDTKRHLFEMGGVFTFVTLFGRNGAIFNR